METRAPNKPKNAPPILKLSQVLDRKARRHYLNYSNNALDLTQIVHVCPRNSGVKVPNDSQQQTVPRVPTIDLSLIGVNKGVKEETNGIRGSQVGEFMSMCKQLAERIQNKKLLYRSEMSKCSSKSCNLLEFGPQDMASGGSNSCTKSIEFESSNRHQAQPQNEKDKLHTDLHSTDLPGLYSHDDVNAKYNLVSPSGCILQALPRAERREVRGNVNYTFNRNLVLSMAKRHKEPISTPSDLQDNIDPISVLAQPTGRPVYAPCAVGTEEQPHYPPVCANVVPQLNASNQSNRCAGDLDAIGFTQNRLDGGISASILRNTPQVQNRRLSYESSKSGVYVIGSDHASDPLQGDDSIDLHFQGDDDSGTFADTIHRNIRPAKTQYNCTSPFRNICTKFDKAFNYGWNSIKQEQATMASPTLYSESAPVRVENVEPTDACSDSKWNTLETNAPISVAKDPGMGESNLGYSSNSLHLQSTDTECRPAGVHVSRINKLCESDILGTDNSNFNRLSVPISDIASIYNASGKAVINLQNEVSPCCAVTRRIGALTHLPSMSGALVKGLSNYSLEHLSELSKVAEKCSLLSACMHERTGATPQGFIPWHLSPSRSNSEVDTPREVRLFFSLPSSTMEVCEFTVNNDPGSLNYATPDSSQMHLRDTDWALLGRPKVKPNTRISGHG